MGLSISFCILICLYFMPMEMLFVSLTAILAVSVFMHRNRFKVALFPGGGIYIGFLLAGMAIGVGGVIFRGYAPRDVCKDMIYVLFPLLFWLLGKNMALDRKRALTGLFLAGAAVSLCDLANGVCQILYRGVSGLTLYQFRKIIGAGHPLTLITLFIYMFMPQNVFLKKKQAFGCLGILLADLLIHFSRITLLNGCIFLLFLRILRKPAKAFRYGFLVATGLAAAYGTFPGIFRNYMDRLVHSPTEISYAREVWDHASVVTNWRGYEVYCALEKFFRAGTLEKIFGGGFGAQLDVKGKAYLVTTEEALPFLHNGYFSVLMVWGVFGCVAFLALLYFLYEKNKAFTGQTRQFWKALAVVLAADNFFVHGILFSPGAASVFLYLGVMGIQEKGGGGSWTEN